MSRCPMYCPHGDRCTLGADEWHPQGGHNRRVCPCNEDMFPVFESKDEAIAHALRTAHAEGNGSVIVHEPLCHGIDRCTCSAITMQCGAQA